MIIDGIAAEIASAVSGLTFNESGAGGNVFVDHMPQAPDVAIAVNHTGGDEADTKHHYDAPHVQVMIRGDQDPRTSTALWYAIYGHMHGLRNKTLPDGTYLVYSIAIQSAPVRLGPDDNGRHELTLNLRCEVKHSTEHRP